MAAAEVLRRSLPLVLFALVLCASAAFAQDEPVSGPDALQESPEAIQLQVETLKKLLAGEVAAEMDLRGVLGVDVRDGAAVEGRVVELRAGIETWTAEREGCTPTDGDDDSAAVSAEASVRIATLDLLLERDGLRLAFLSQPTEQLAAALAGVEEQRRLAAERAAAEIARLAAEAAARLAEEARQQALAEAAEARSVALAELAAERARVEQMRSDAAAQLSAYADERLARAEAAGKRLDLVQRVDAAVESGELAPSAADDLYDECVAMLTAARADLKKALDTQRSPSNFPAFEPEIDLQDDIYLAQPLQLDALQQAIEALDAERAVAQIDETRQRWEKVDTFASQLLSLDDGRLTLIAHLSRDKRERVMGLGPQGLGQLAREAGHLRLMARWYVRDRVRSLGDAPGWALDVLGRASTRWVAVSLLALLAFTLYLQRRRVALLTYFNKTVRLRTRGSSYQRTALRWLRLANALADEVVLLAVVWVGFGLLLRLLPAPEVVLLRQVALTYAVYRLVIAAVHQFFISLMTVTRSAVPAALSERVLRSLRFLGGYALAVVVFLIVSTVVTGRGYLYRLVQDFAWLGAIPILAILLRHWRDDIFEAHLWAFPSSRLGERIRERRERPTALLLAVPAVAQLSVRAVGVYVRTAALRFERIRKALAYLFRRQMETQAVAVGKGVADLAELPDRLTDAFNCVASPDLCVDHFPDMDVVTEAVGRVGSAAPGFAVAVVGARGSGKTTWLAELQRRCEGVTFSAGVADHSLLDEADVCRMLSQVVGTDEVSTVEELTTALLDAGPRVVVLDHGHNFVLRAVRGTDPYVTLTRLVRRTSGRVMWVCAFAQHTWEYLDFAAGAQDVFQRVVTLPGWPEPEVQELIDLRMAATGYEASYEDLATKDVHPLQREAELAQTRERYLRLLWDYTDGIPALAQQFWLRSLVPDGDAKVRVRLFEGPVPDRLERLAEQSRFVLNAVVSHEELTLDEAVLVLQYPPQQCLSLLEQLRSRRYLQFVDGRYRVDPLWDRAAVRYLRRKHLLYK